MSDARKVKKKQRRPVSGSMRRKPPLPAAKSAPATPPPAAARPARAAPDAETGCIDRFARALVLEDDDPLRRTLARLLRSWNTEVVEAKTVAEATRLLATHRPELVITDVRLPDGTGAALAEAAAGCSPRPLVVAMSGLASAGEAFALAQCGVRIYLTKPFAPQELVHGIAELLQAGAPAQQPSSVPERAAPSESELLAANLERFAERHNFTMRELALVRLAMAGVPRVRCPGLLNVSENTCKTMTRRILQRCGARSLADIPRLVLAESALR